MTRQARLRLAALGAILAATAIAYLPCVDGEFLLDDYLIPGDPLVLAPFQHGIGDWLQSPRPVAALTFALNHLAGGLDPRGWHLTNVAIHLAAVLLAWAFARATFARAGLSRPDRPALAAAALFALHPLQSEAVAYLSQRSEALASALYLAALLALLARDRATGARRGALLGGATALHAAALLTKPIAATLPAAWLLHAALLPAAGEEDDGVLARVRRRILPSLPLFALSAWAAARGLGGTRHAVHAGFDVPGLPPSSYLATQLRAIPTYLRLLVWPAGQSGDWYFRASRSFLEPAVIAGAILLAVLVGGALVLALRAGSDEGDGPAAARVAGFGLPFFLLALAPSSSFVPLLDPLAEHRPYLAALGPFLAVAAAGAAALRRMTPARAVAAGIAVTVLAAGTAGALTWRRAGVWSSALAFWSNAAEQTPAKARVHLNLAHALYYLRLTEPALAELRIARDLSGDATIARETVLANIVSVLLSQRRVGEARDEVARALSEDPEDSAALAFLAKVELAAGRYDEAERAATASLDSPLKTSAIPTRALALEALGGARTRRGDLAGALSAYRRAAESNPVDPEVYLHLGTAEGGAGDLAAACRAFARAVELPGNPSASQEAARRAGVVGCR